MVFLVPEIDQNVIYVGISKIQIPQHLINERQESSVRRYEVQRSCEEIRKSERRCDGSLQNIAGVYGDLVICYNQVYRGENSASERL